jgi:hypothetical protein
MMMSAALIDTPMEPIRPMIALIPKGKSKTASDSIDRPADSPLTTSATPASRKERKVMTTTAMDSVTIRPSGASRLLSVEDRASLSPPISSR